jgi:glycosyltransferase involved in cell wall biosynthesis
MSAPAISVIVPTRNRAASLRVALASLSALEFPTDAFEVIVVDNGSTDDTAAAAAAFARSHPALSLRTVAEPEPGLLAGRHRGAREARAPLMAFVDDDVEVSPRWLAAVVDAFADPAVHLVGGPSRPRFEVEPPAWLEWLWTGEHGGRSLGDLSLLDLGAETRRIDPTLVWGLNFSIRAATLVALGGFHPDCMPKALQRYQGDGETGLALAARAGGRAAVYAPLALLHHRLPATRLSVAALEERHFYQGVCNSYAEIRAAGCVPSGRDFKEAARRLRGLARAAGGERARLRARLEIGRAHV